MSDTLTRTIIINATTPGDIVVAIKEEVNRRYVEAVEAYGRATKRRDKGANFARVDELDSLRRYLNDIVIKEQP